MSNEDLEFFKQVDAERSRGISLDGEDVPFESEEQEKDFSKNIFKKQEDKGEENGSKNDKENGSVTEETNQKVEESTSDNISVGQESTEASSETKE